MSTTATPDVKKIAKASAERVRKAKLKAAADKTPQTIIIWEPTAGAAGTFLIASVSVGGDVTAEGSPSFATIDDAKTYLKTAAEQPEAAAEAAAEPVADDGPKPELTLRAVYLLAFDSFAVSVSDVAEHFGVTTKQARAELKKLLRRGLVATQDVNDEGQGNGRKGQYGQIVWQTTPTYDDSTRDEAEERIDAALAPKSAAKPTGKSEAAEAELASRLPEYSAEAAARLTDADLAVLFRVVRREYRGRRRAAA